MQPIYLTFDDGPDPEWTPRILDVLAQAGVAATFFMIGRQAQRHPMLARRIVAEGHVPGNHTFSHRHPWLIAASAARAEVRDGARALRDVLGDVLGDVPGDASGEPVAFFRPPHGRLRPCMKDQAICEGQSVVLWDRSAMDWGALGRAQRIAARLARVRAHEVLLMHDARNRHNRPDELLRVLPEFLRTLPERALQAAPLPRDARREPSADGRRAA